MAECLSRSAWGFDPRSIPRCMSWIDAADTSTLTTSGANVTAIRDKANYVNYSITGNSLPTTGSVTLNGNNMLSLTNDCSAIITGNFSNQYRTVFFVAQIDNATVPVTAPRTYNFIGGTTAGASFGIYYWHGTGAIAGGRSGLNATTVDSNYIPSGFFNSSFILSYANFPTTSEIRLNGVPLRLTTNTAFVLTTGNANQTINGSSANRQGWRLGEMLLYDDVLNPTNRQIVEGYLARKWGLTANLPDGHLLKTNRLFGQAFRPPIDLSGCVLWLDAADRNRMTIFSGSNVSQWSDKSGSNNHATQSTLSNQPVFVENVRNGLPVMRFSGLGGVNRTDTRFLENTGMSFPAPPYTVFAVAQAVSNAASSAHGYNYIFKPSRATDWYFMLGSLSNSFTAFAGTSTIWRDTAGLTGGTQPTSNWSVLTVVNLGTTLGLIPYISGNARGAKNGGLSGAAAGYTVGDAPLGFRGQNWNGDIAEIIVFNRDMSYTDRYLIEGYLAWKWGITADLPAAHSYKNTRLNPQGPLYTIPTTFTWSNLTISNGWGDIAMSPDGDTLICSADNYVSQGGIGSANSPYVSTNGGASWSSVRVGGITGAQSIYSVAIAKGTPGTMYAAQFSNVIWKTTDYGNTWTAMTPTGTWTGVKCSANGQIVIATNTGVNTTSLYERIVYSANGGSTWSRATNPTTGSFISCAISADGVIMYAGQSGGSIFVSSNTGNTFTSTGLASTDYYPLKCSSNGQFVVAGRPAALPLFSSNRGTSWIDIPNAPIATLGQGNSRNSIAISEDGNVIFSGNTSTTGYVTLNRGTTWTTHLALIPSGVLGCSDINLNNQKIVTGQYNSANLRIGLR